MAASSVRRSALAKPDQDERPVAPARQVVLDGGEQRTQHSDGGGALLARVRRLAADAGQGPRHLGVVGQHRAAGGVVQVGDGGPADIEGGGGAAAVALAGEEAATSAPAAGRGLTPC